MVDNSEVSSNLQPTITVEGLTEMIATMRTSTEMMTTMRTTLLELQNEVAIIKQQLSTPVVQPQNGTNAVATPTMSTLRLRCSTFDGTDPEIWINEVVSFMNSHRVPREQWVIVATFYLEKEAKKMVQLAPDSDEFHHMAIFYRESACPLWTDNIQSSFIAIDAP
ncbi:hypothetical protein MRB53_024232 [Persea americana]|uniref:Uncharacterized protein n=1 Tax=Persea americana TaxID=3435 RepID=A0ACC2LBR6_PERAE|nr:hypothetical protein MRB53_024232 [Persea americana]